MVAKTLRFRTGTASLRSDLEVSWKVPPVEKKKRIVLQSRGRVGPPSRSHDHKSQNDRDKNTALQAAIVVALGENSRCLRDTSLGIGNLGVSFFGVLNCGDQSRQELTLPVRDVMGLVLSGPAAQRNVF